MAALARPCAIAAGLGVVVHLGYFIRGEHHRMPFRWITRTLQGVTTLTLLCLHFTGYQVVTTLVLTLALTLSFFAGLYGSMTLYRVFFHPLRKFKGPRLAPISNFWHSYTIRKSDNYLVMKRLHEQYGDVIRTGPSNISINDPAAIPLVLSDKAKCVKGPWYDRSLPLVNLHTVRDKKVHDLRRRVFSKAFSPAAMREYEARVVVHCQLFVDQMKKVAGRPFDASEWCKYFAFDVMGDVGLGKEFHMLTEATNRWIPPLLEHSMAHVGMTSPVPWMAPILHKMPGAGAGARQWLEFVGSQVKERVAKDAGKKDILGYLVEAYNESEKKDIDYIWLRGDTRLTIVGGSDTTAATLTFILYHLAKDPSQYAKLRAELEPLLEGDRSHLAQEDVAKAVHLNGVIQEALRLHPAIPSGFPRIAPPEGVTIGDTYIPAGTTIIIPLYAMQHDERNYQDAEAFVPERWYSRPDMIKNRDAFLTWNVGTNGCIGRALAIMEMKDFICHVVKNFESVRFAPGEDGEALAKLTKDHFTLGVKPMELIFEERKGS